MKTFLAVVVLMLAAIAANAQSPHVKDKSVWVFYHAPDLKEMCEYQDIYPGKEMKAAMQDISKQGRCTAYILAFAELVGDASGVSIPADTPGQAIVDSVRAWVKYHAELTDEKLNLPAQIVLIQALQALYPVKR
jgi:Rap1a immunity proteins